MAGGDKDIETKQMVVITKWWWRQGPVCMITCSSKESEDEAIAGEVRGWEKRVMSLSQV